MGPKTSLEGIQNGMEEEELVTQNLDDTFKKFLLDKNIEKGGIIWKEIRLKTLVFRWQELLFVRLWK